MKIIQKSATFHAFDPKTDRSSVLGQYQSATQSTDPVVGQVTGQVARQVFALFSKQDNITAQDVAHVLGLTARMARILMQKWVSGGFLEAVDKSNRSRSYGLSEIYRKFVGN